MSRAARIASTGSASRLSTRGGSVVEVGVGVEVAEPFVKDDESVDAIVESDATVVVVEVLIDGASATTPVDA